MVYALILALIWPVLVLLCLARGESLGDVAERLGRGAGKGPALWLHGASNGELASARWLIEALQAARPGLRLVVTANTVTGRALVRGWALPGVTAVLAPMDTGLALRAFLARWRPLGLISLEGEIWPNRLAHLAAAGLPVAMLGARMSAGSAGGWGRFPRLIGRALGGVQLASAQDAASRVRLQALGLPAAAWIADCDLKSVAWARATRPPRRPRAERAGTLLAASTHEGEEEIVLDGFAASGLQALILAPRHAVRGDAVAGLLTARGLEFARRSAGAEPGDTPIFLADTMGEMDLWYASAGICVVGGTFTDRGGHTPWEPAAHGCALVHGPDVANFAAPFAALDAAGGAVAVTALGLGAALAGLDGAAQERMAAAADRTLAGAQGGTALAHAVLKTLSS
jgi:3-deoxy-D-manno-octulosonic-acid transferase